MNRIVALAIVAIVPPLAAQAPPTFTVGEMLDRTQQCAASAHFSAVKPEPSRLLDSVIAVLRATDVTGATVGDMAAASTGNQATLRQVLRWDRRSTSAMVQPAVQGSMLAFRQIVTSRLDSVLRDSLGDDSTRTCLAPVEAFRDRFQELSQQTLTDRLRRYEVKYGPEAPKLNAVEVLVNYLAQWVWPFAGTEAGPSPFELVTSYSAADLAVSSMDSAGTHVTLASGTQLGVRVYLFGPGRGSGSRIDRFLKPTHVAFGVVSMNESTQGLNGPFEGHQQVGGFLSWGNARVAFAGGSNWRLMLSVGSQLLPYLF